MFVHKAAVVGGGTMGGQIAQAIAAADIPVVVKDVDQKFVDHAIEEVRNVTAGQLASKVKKEKITQEQADARLEEVLANVTGTVTYDEFGDVDFVIEAVPEKMAIKQAVFAELDAVTPGHAILSSNTSALSISEIGEAGHEIGAHQHGQRLNIHDDDVDGAGLDASSRLRPGISVHHPLPAAGLSTFGTRSSRSMTIDI